jgi:hypothetical protein
MSEKSILEQALLQINTLEEAVKQNAKGILASTMKEELKDLLKESLEEEEDDVDDTTANPNGEEEKDMSDDDAEDEDADDTEDDTDLDNDDTSDDTDSEDSDETDSEDVDAEDEFGTDDFGSGDDSDVDTEMGTDLDTDSEDEDVMDMTGASDAEVLKIFKAMKPEDGIVVKRDGNKVELETGDDEFIIKLDGEGGIDDDDESGVDTDFGSDLDEMNINTEMDGDSNEGFMSNDEDMMNEEEEETIYEIEMEEDEDAEEMEATESALPGLSKPKKVEPKENALPGLGKPKKVEPKESALPGLSKPKKVEPKESALPGLSKPKKVEPKESALPGLSKPKKVEPKESARTFALHKKGNGGTQFLSGSKGMNTNKAGSLNEEVENLRNQNAEYKKALVLFKEKLNEVAVFNANLAYATRIFTEHSTTKQEKLNILKRFDTVSTMNESKGLYNTIATELGSKTTVTESVAGKISNTPQSSSSQEMLSESKAYENPQFARMKDLMKKVK